MSKPITKWRDAARILGMCEDTLCKRRKQHRDRMPHPWWESEQAVIDWYKAMTTPREERPAKPAARAPKAPSGRVLDSNTRLDDLITG